MPTWQLFICRQSTSFFPLFTCTPTHHGPTTFKLTIKLFTFVLICLMFSEPNHNVGFNIRKQHGFHFLPFFHLHCFMSEYCLPCSFLSIHACHCSSSETYIRFRERPFSMKMMTSGFHHFFDQYIYINILYTYNLRNTINKLHHYEPDA